MLPAEVLSLSVLSHAWEGSRRRGSCRSYPIHLFSLWQDLPVLTAALQPRQQTAREVLPPWRLLQTPNITRTSCVDSSCCG